MAMSNFHVKKQVFTTMDMMSLLVLLGTVCTLSGAILADAMQSDGSHRAKIMAKSLASQIRAERERTEIAPIGSLRGPASEDSVSPASLLVSGTIGHDPWGHPFHYFVRKETPVPGARKTKAWVYVWSDGPDGQSSTTTEGQFSLGGDDIGQVEEFTADL
jgi:hypothetical protein